MNRRIPRIIAAITPPAIETAGSGVGPRTHAAPADCNAALHWQRFPYQPLPSGHSQVKYCFSSSSGLLHSAEFALVHGFSLIHVPVTHGLSAQKSLTTQTVLFLM